MDELELANAVWARYAYCRDNGHADFIAQADRCFRFYRGEHWRQADRAQLNAERRPALTTNMVLPTVNTALGELILNKSEAACRPQNGSDPALADIMTKVLKHIGEANHLQYLRSDVVRDGVITGRGFFDVRLAYNDNLQGEVRISALNPKNVVIDPDGEEYDPDTWGEVFTTKWLTVDDIEVIYGKKKAGELRSRTGNNMLLGYDSIDEYRDRFGLRYNTWYGTPSAQQAGVTRGVRVIERQYRKLNNQEHFLDPQTGDTRPVPDGFDRNRVALLVQEHGFRVVKQLVRRIRWTVIADNQVLHDDWSPYKHFTVVPFFPYFIRGKAFGMVENLIDSQELLNKTLSQELHVINTSANSGWKFKSGALANMTPAEFEQKGARSGLVIEVNENVEDVQKIQPNNIPQGLNLVSQKAGEHIKQISGVTNSMLGTDREDVSGKALQKKRAAGAMSLAVVEDNMNRTEAILARNVLDIVQMHYTEPRILTITHNAATNEVETFEVNQVTAEGAVLNDLTAGEYGITIVSVPFRETLEDSQFDQMLALREAGVAIPDETLIEVSRLQGKAAVLERIRGDASGPEAQAATALQQRATEAAVAKTEAEAQQKGADAQLRMAKAQAALQPKDDGGRTLLEQNKSIAAQGLAEQKFQHEREMALLDRAVERERMEQERIDKQRAAEVAAAQADAQRALDAGAQETE